MHSNSNLNLYDYVKGYWGSIQPLTVFFNYTKRATARKIHFRKAENVHSNLIMEGKVSGIEQDSYAMGLLLHKDPIAPQRNKISGRNDSCYKSPAN